MRKTQKSMWNLLPIRGEGSKPPLFWIHGDASDHYLTDYLDSDQPIYAFKHQGRHGERACYTEVEKIAAYYLRQVSVIQQEGPYFLGGYSFGGTVAFEMAQQLQARGNNVPFLFMIDSRFPGIDNPSSSCPPFQTPFYDELQRHLRDIRGLKAQQMVNYFATRVRDKFQQRLRRVIKPLKAILIKVYLGMDRPLPYYLRNQYILKVYFDALPLYKPKPYNGPATYIKSSERSSAHSAHWAAVIQRGLEVYEVPATNHMDIIALRNGPLWAEKLKMSLRRSQEAYVVRPSSVKETTRRHG